MLGYEFCEFAKLCVVRVAMAGVRGLSRWARKKRVGFVAFSRRGFTFVAVGY